MSGLSFTIYVTTKCNMNCSYCYEKGFVAADMSFEIADKVISFIHEKMAEEEADLVNVQFHGGEPLLNLVIIEYLINALDKTAAKGKVVFRYAMTTNATLFKKEMIPLLEKFDSITVSIDGEERVHDHHRVFKNQEGTHQLVVKNIREMIKKIPNIMGRATLTSETYKEVYNSFLYIIDLGINNVGFELDFSGNNWTGYMIEEYISEFKKIADTVHEKQRMGINIEVPLLNTAITKTRNSICNGGKTSFTITPDGGIYPCLVSIATNELLLGKIGQSKNVKVLNKIEEVAKLKNTSCDGCARYDYCRATRCKIINYIYNGDFLKSSPIFCSNERIKIEIGKYFSNMTI